MADEVFSTKFQLDFWNGQYYCKTTMPDGSKSEIKSDKDLTYTQWQEKIKEIWDASQIPQPVEECRCPACEKSFICPNRGIK